MQILLLYVHRWLQQASPHDLDALVYLCSEVSFFPSFRGLAFSIDAEMVHAHKQKGKGSNLSMVVAALPKAASVAFNESWMALFIMRWWPV